MKVAICGSNGFVGTAMGKLFPQAVLFDVNKGSWDEVNACDICFICVPSNLLPDKTLDMSIVEDVVSKCNCPLIIIRSTLNPGTCDRLKNLGLGKNICMMPEYVGESIAHPLLDESKRQFLIIGGLPEDRRKVIELFQTVYNANISIRQVTNYEAEVIKLSENRAIAFKMMEIQELFDACEAAKVDYYTIREAVYNDDPRMSLWWSWVFPDKRGFNNSKCLKKDIPAWCSWAESVGIDPILTKTLIKKSNDYAKH